jgi:hypothetical protein
METDDRAAGWRAHLEEFSRRNRARPTRLGELKRGDVLGERWIEDGLPLEGVSFEPEGRGGPRVGIMLGRRGETESGMTHAVARVSRIRLQLTADGAGDGLDIEDAEGVTTILRFETPAD